MTGRRIVYLAALAGCGVFYIAYGAWFSWLVLLAALGLPWLSLAVSLPAMVRFRLEVGGPDALTVGTPGQVWLLGSSAFPLPPFTGRLLLQDRLSGGSLLCRSGEELPTDHCGCYSVTIRRGRVCDYLGLFALPAGRREERTILVRPRPVEMPEPPDLRRYIARSWRPKFGGGFAENHELRLYRPGDSLNQIHWKLSAKTGRLTVREPMVPQRGLALLTMTVRGTPEELDRKFGRLLWLGRYLLERQVPFQLRALTAQGVVCLEVPEAGALDRAVDELLRAGAAASGSIRERTFAASWHCHIGGAPNEA